MFRQMHSNEDRSGETKGSGEKTQQRYLFVLTVTASVMKRPASHLMSGVLRAAGVLLTNNRVAAITAQHVVLEPFRETAGDHYLLPLAAF